MTAPAIQALLDDFFSVGSERSVGEAASGSPNLSDVTAADVGRTAEDPDFVSTGDVVSPAFYSLDVVFAASGCTR